jgi:hypothetical protein
MTHNDRLALTKLAHAKIKQHLTPLEWIRYEMAEDKEKFVAEFCAEKLRADTFGVRRLIRKIFNHAVKLYDLDNIYKGDGLDRYVKQRKGSHMALVR